jgi:tRNA threonylcarbamoyladenosine biosynthesis protein TsaE
MIHRNISIASLASLHTAAKELLTMAGDARVFIFFGDMGSGKTTLIKELCRTLGCKDNLSSPTYSIINQYDYENGKIFHFDLYRLKTAAELLDLGIEEYLTSGSYCFFEWPELVEEMLEPPYLKIVIETNELARELHVTKT